MRRRSGKEHEHWRVYEVIVQYNVSSTVREEDFTLTDLALYGLLQPGVASIELLVANGLGGQEGTSNRNDSVGG